MTKVELLKTCKRCNKEYKRDYKTEIVAHDYLCKDCDGFVCYVRSNYKYRI